MFALNVFFITVTVVSAENKLIYYYGPDSGHSRNMFGTSKLFGIQAQKQSNYEKNDDNLKNQNEADVISLRTGNDMSVNNYEDALRIQGTAFIRNPQTENNKRDVKTDQFQVYYNNILGNTASNQQAQLELQESNLKYNKQPQKQSDRPFLLLYPYSKYNVELISTTDNPIIGPESFQIRNSVEKYENQRKLEENNIKFNESIPFKEPEFLNTLTRIDEITSDKIDNSNLVKYGQRDFQNSRDKARESSLQSENEQNYLQRIFLNSDRVSNANKFGLQPSNRSDLKETQFINTLTRIDDYVTDDNVDVLTGYYKSNNNKTEIKQVVFRNKSKSDDDLLFESQSKVDDQNKNPQAFNIKRTMSIPFEQGASKNYSKSMMRDTDRTYVTVEVVPLVQYYNDSNVARDVMKEVTRKTPGAAPLATFAAGCLPGTVRVFEICVPKH